MIESKFAKDVLYSLFDEDVESENALKHVDYLIEKEIKHTESGVFVFSKYNKGIEEFKLDESIKNNAGFG